MDQIHTPSPYTNREILAWLQYFSDQTDVALDLERVKILDLSRKNKNLIPTVESNRLSLVLSGGGLPNLFYDLWAAGLGECQVWFRTGTVPSGAPESKKIWELIDRELDAPAVLLISNPAARSSYKIGIDNGEFSSGSIRYVGSEIRAVIMSMLHVDIQDVICIISGESIAVEAAMVASEGTIIAVEYNHNDRAAMDENVTKFGLNNVDIVENCSVDTLSGHPVPSLAFIVASDHLEEEIRSLLTINPNIQFVIYTLELNILAAIPPLFEQYGIRNMEVTQIAVSKLNSKNQFVAQPAPWLISGEPGPAAEEK